MIIEHKNLDTKLVFCRLLREESLIDGSSDDSDDSSDNEQTWGFHPRPSPAVQHPPDTSTIKKSDIHTIITNSMGNYSRRSRDCTFGKIMERSIHGGYGKRKMQKQILTSAHLLPHNGVQVPYLWSWEWDFGEWKGDLYFYLKGKGIVSENRS